MNNETSTFKKIFFVFITFFILILFLELLLQLWFLISKKGTKRFQYGQQQLINKENWLLDFYSEQQNTEIEFKSYLQWRRKKYKGKYLNISEKGVRKTWNPKVYDVEKPELIFCFGGSTMHGSPARDEYTIPSILSKKLNKNKTKYRVVNLGETAYVSMQEIIYLILLLKNGNIPDYVIFYDGANDVYSSWQNGKPGEIQNLYWIKKKLKRNRKEPLISINKEKIGIYKSLRIIKNKVMKPVSIEGIKTSGLDEDELIALSNKTIKDYESNIKLVENLSKIYGFECYFFWQPLLFSKKYPSDTEKKYKQRKNKSLQFLYHHCNKQINLIKSDNFYNLTDVFNGYKGTIFVDHCHVSETGNEIIAEKIFDIFIKSENKNM